MHLSTQIDSPSHHSFTSGFGVVMEQEHELQSLVGNFLGAVEDPRAAALDRILRHHHVLLGANIALLEQSFASLPHPARFEALHRKLLPLSKSLRAVADPASPGTLAELVALHLSLAACIDAFLERRYDARPGETSLAEVAQNHAEMAWMLTALIREDESRRDQSPMPGAAEGEWENEGGALQSDALTRRDTVVETS